MPEKRKGNLSQPTQRQLLGRWGEDTAAHYLSRQGLTELGRNMRTPFGEIDLVMQQGAGKEATIIFIEVKTRRGGAYGLPEEAVNIRKQQHLHDAAVSILQSHPEYPENWRVDVVAIRQITPGSDPEITWFENALTLLS
jgi:putative endonuclease